MKLVTTEKKYLEDTIFEIAYETIEKFSGLNASTKIENLEASKLFDLEDCYIIGSKISTELIDQSDYEE